MKILVTGGAGFIGSHTCVELLNNGYDIVVLDNLSNAKYESINRIKKITGKDFDFYEEDLLNLDGLRKIFKEHKIDSTIHFAGLKAVGESVFKPLEYYHNNITGTLMLLTAMKEAGVNSIVFSSSATVYGSAHKPPYTEDMEAGGCTNPYGQTKVMIEIILKDFQHANPNLSISILRYFNPIGAHESGLIGENPNGIPNNLMPYITQVAVGKLKELSVFGNDYNTPDGTGVRDYIHVCDLARGHVLALKYIESHKGCFIHNLGSGKGTSVLQLVHGFEKASGIKIPYKITDRRPGDIDESFAGVEKAKKELGFEVKYDVEKMCEDSFRWQKQNPNGL